MSARRAALIAFALLAVGCVYEDRCSSGFTRFQGRCFPALDGAAFCDLSVHGCGTGNACDVLLGAPRCRSEGVSERNTGCGADTDCQIDLHCTGNVCRLLCNEFSPPSLCGDLEACMLQPGWEFGGVRYGVCLPRG